jgi:DNA-binding transcriptional regulator YiaG
MTPATIKAIRTRAGLTQSQLAALLRISDLRTVRRWESGDVPVSGPASIVLELLEAGELPERYLLAQL